MREPLRNADGICYLEQPVHRSSVSTETSDVRLYGKAQIYYTLDNRDLDGRIRNITVLNCTFTRNSAHGVGGGMSSYGSPTLFNCIFFSNWARECGGAMYNGGGTAALINCTLTQSRNRESNKIFRPAHR